MIEIIYLAGFIITFLIGWVFWIGHWEQEFKEITPLSTIWAAVVAALQAFLWPLFVPFYLVGLTLRRLRNGPTDIQ